MVNITKCNNYNCQLKESCYRHTVLENRYQQSYMNLKNEVTKESDCEYFWDNGK